MAVGGVRIQESEKTAISVSRRFYMDDSVPNATWFRGGGIRKPLSFRISVSLGMEYPDFGNRIRENTLDGNGTNNTG